MPTPTPTVVRDRICIEKALDIFFTVRESAERVSDKVVGVGLG
jgi:hypothetical protein